MQRCSNCLMHLNLCICPLLQDRWPNRTRVVMVIHAYDVRKPTNTGRLLPMALQNSALHVRGRLGEPTRGEELVATTGSSLVLFPAANAQVLSREMAAQLPQPITLIVPDGTWRQASKMPNRIPQLKNLPRVVLPEGKLSEYRLRTEKRYEHGLGTMEAVARALGILEGKEIEEHLMHIFRAMVERTLWTKGKLRKDEVYGGIPAIG